MGGFGGDFGPGPTFNIMFTVVPIFIAIIFLLLVGSLVFKGVAYAKNARAPRESIYARVVAKRTEVRGSTHHHNHGDGSLHASGSSRTYYYITLEFDDRSRREYLDVKNLYGLVVEGDAGYAAIQGDWLVAFERG